MPKDKDKNKAKKQEVQPEEQKIVEKLPPLDKLNLQVLNPMANFDYQTSLFKQYVKNLLIQTQKEYTNDSLFELEVFGDQVV